MILLLLVYLEPSSNSLTGRGNQKQPVDCSRCTKSGKRLSKQREKAETWSEEEDSLFTGWDHCRKSKLLNQTGSSQGGFEPLERKKKHLWKKRESEFHKAESLVLPRRWWTTQTLWDWCWGWGGLHTAASVPSGHHLELGTALPLPAVCRLQGQAKFGVILNKLDCELVSYRECVTLVTWVSLKSQQINPEVSLNPFSETGPRPLVWSWRSVVDQLAFDTKLLFFYFCVVSLFPYNGA